MTQSKAVATDLQRARALHGQGDRARARRLCERLVKLHPRQAESWMLLGRIAQEDKNPLEAREFFSTAVDLDPADPIAHWYLGNASCELRRWDAALACYGNAVEGNPRFAEAHCNLGNVHRILERWEDALACYDRALKLDPDYRMVWSNRGIVLKELHRFDAASASFDRAVALAHDDASARFNRGILRLLTGDFAQGWPDYEWRWEDRAGPVFPHKRTFAQPRWQRGVPLQGKTILLYEEQGYGDTLQFCRYVPAIAALGARVVLEVRAPLVMLLVDLEGVSQLVCQGRGLPSFDYQCPLMSLPAVLQTTSESIPCAAKYLYGDVGKVAAWRAALGDRNKPRIGLAWSGNPAHANDSNRSMAASLLAAELPPEFHYVVLQHDVREADRGTLDATPHWMRPAELHDFSDTAALCENLDLVISVDSSVAHLSSALGRPTWILLPHHPDWRWQLGRTDSPWYPSLKLYRQSVRGDWRSVLGRVAADLRRLFDGAM